MPKRSSKTCDTRITSEAVGIIRCGDIFVLKIMCTRPATKAPRIWKAEKICYTWEMKLCCLKDKFSRALLVKFATPMITKT